MNYYKQGDAANADKIKAAFGKYVSTQEMAEYDFSQEEYLFYTGQEERGTFVYAAWSDSVIAEIIKTHPDYKELELPVEPKFKKWDWIACDADSFTLSIKSVKDGNYFFHQGASLPIKDIDEHYHLWTIADAKDGDVLVTTKIRSCPFIYRKTNYNNNLAYYYAGIDGNGDFCEGCLKKTLYHFGSVSDVIPATKKQRDLLFAKMKEAGYEWDAGKKELKKIQSHYDIANFHVGMPVLVRADNDCSWDYSVFSRITGNKCWPFAVCNGVIFTQCIPYNDYTKHLLGTTDMCDEQYINW